MNYKTLTGLFVFIMFALSPLSTLAAEEAKPTEEALSSEALAKANAKLESSFDSTKAQVEEGVNIAVADGTEEAKKLEDAAKEAALTIPVNPAWEGMEPKIEIVKWGPEFRIKVKTNPGMKNDRMMAIKSVKLETVKGEFLGLKTYSAEEKTRDAEFMVNAEILKIDTVKITVTSPQDGEYVTLSALKVTEVPEVKKAVADAAALAVAEVKDGAEKAAAVSEAAPAAEVPAAKPAGKKKGWW